LKAGDLPAEFVPDGTVSSGAARFGQWLPKSGEEGQKIAEP
jgi:hypothetical protein